MWYYAIHFPIEHRGIYETWSECSHRVRGVSKAKFKKFKNTTNAKYFAKKGKCVPLFGYQRTFAPMRVI